MPRRTRRKKSDKGVRRDYQAYSRSVGFSPGDIKVSARLFAEDGWFFCDGAEKNRANNVRLFEAICPTFTGTTTAGSDIMTGIEDTSFLFFDCEIEGTGLTPGCSITAVFANSIQMVFTATSSGTNTFRVFPFGAGNSSTTFNMPDYRGKAIVGAGKDPGYTFGPGNPGDVYGDEFIGLLTGNMPSHNHGGATASGGAHDHTVYGNKNIQTPNTGAFDRIQNFQNPPGGGGANAQTSSDGAHTHTIPSAGNGDAVQNTQPSLVAKVYIKR